MVEWSTAPCSSVNPSFVVLNSAPPHRLLRSSTSTSSPARARYAAQTRPLWPPPTTTTSARDDGVAGKGVDHAGLDYRSPCWGIGAHEGRVLTTEGRTSKERL